MLETLNQAPAIALSRKTVRFINHSTRTISPGQSEFSQAGGCQMHRALQLAGSCSAAASRRKNEKDPATKRALEQAEHDLVHGI